MPARDRPAREHEVAVASPGHGHGWLKNRVAAEVASQEPGLIVVIAAADVAIDLLQADEVGIFRLDAGDDPLQ